MKYKSVIATRNGGPEVLQVIENELRPPKAGEVRIRVLTAAVSRPDITVRAGKALYSGTPLGQKVPFVPGYAVIGVVDALGEGVSEVSVGERVGALTVVGGYSEVLYWKSKRLIPVPPALEPVEAVTLILNYIVAYQALHRSAKVKAGDKVLLIGASGGIGTALLQLGKLAGLKMYGVASRSKHALLAEYGAVPIDYHTQDFVDVVRQAEPDGLQAVISGMTRMDYVRRGLELLRQEGTLVSFGEPDSFSTLFRILGTMLKVNLLPNGKTVKLYGTSTYFIGDKRPYLEDWAALFKLLEEGQIRPVIEKKFPILEAAQANALLESGQVTGNLVLVTPELL
ncbi:MAG TPA: medium chain dehydrogenase/reductase family protein [Anaerolineales bacterium]|nr:medium chain dehydrogenase/reductase family protein [Anaerolineales bacterium]